MKSLEYSHLINVDTFLCPFGVCTREVRLPRERERERERESCFSIYQISCKEIE